MMPTEEEKNKILEAQMSNSELPLGSAEQFLLTLCSISELSARLNLWAFKLDYESVESVCNHIFLIVLECLVRNNCFSLLINVFQYLADYK